MTKDFQMVHKTHADKKCSLDFLSRSVEEKVRAYHRSFPVYKETPLACLKETAKALWCFFYLCKRRVLSFRPQCLQGPGWELCYGALSCR